MAGERIPGPLGRDPLAADVPWYPTGGTFASPVPIGVDSGGPTELDTGKKIVKVTKDWSDPPSVTPTFTPEVSGNTLKAVLAELQKLSEWGSGGGNLNGTGPGGEIRAEPSDDGKGYTVALKGEFFITLPKWKEYATATDPQKTAWDAMIANLKKHEEEHVAIAYRGAQKLVKDLTGLVVTLAPQKVADAQTAIQNAQDDFDSPAKTDHGNNDFGSFKKVVLDTSADPPPAPPKPPTP